MHVDGQKEHHDFSVCREGGYELAIDGIREAVQRGFRVTTNTTLFDGADPKSVRAIFRRNDGPRRRGHDALAGLLLRQGAGPAALPRRARTRRLFRAILSNRKPSWRFNQRPLFLEFLMGKRNTPARPGACRRTTSSAGRSPATYCRTATPTPSRN